MPRSRRMIKTRRHTDYRFHLDHGVWCQLCSGFDWKGDEFGEGENFDEAEARRAWDAIGEELTAIFVKGFPDQQPWAFWKFGPSKGARRAA